MIRSGFFDSMNGDRKYDASKFAEYFASFIGNGVFPDSLQVISNGNMTVTVKAGKAWINGYILINDADYILNINAADGVLNRIDRIVLRYDVVDREIRLEVKKGAFASIPVAQVLQRDTDAYELCLADISVVAGAVNISQDKIIDKRSNTELCGKVDTLIAGDFLSLSESVNNKLDITGEGKDVTVTFKEAANEAQIESGEKLSIIFGKILKKFKSIIPITSGGTGASTAANARANLDVPPTNHASAFATYGVGTTANYGHVRIVDGLGAGPGNLDALSAYQGRVLNDKVVSLNSNFYANRLPTRQLLASGTVTVPIGTTKLMLVTTLTIVEPIDVVYVGTCRWGTSGSSNGGFSRFVFPFDIARYPYDTSNIGSYTHSVDSTLGLNLIDNCGFRRVGNTIEVYMTLPASDTYIRTYPYDIKVYY